VAQGSRFDPGPSMPYNESMERLLPIGIQDFADIRERGFCYVDKTAIIHRLISGSGKPFFLSRPRRFGKSLLCSTIRAIFEGRREVLEFIDKGYMTEALGGNLPLVNKRLFKP